MANRIARSPMTRHVVPGHGLHCRAWSLSHPGIPDHLDPDVEEAVEDMGGCQNYGPFLGPWYNTAPRVWGTQKGTIILTTTHTQGCARNPIQGATWGALLQRPS